jgi:hypothetical protein
MTQGSEVARLESRYEAWCALMKRMLPADVSGVLLDRGRFDRHLTEVASREADAAHVDGLRVSRGRFS